ncbi:peptidylprolyl isomerase [Phenylobacterium deserti]|uniref:Parvulin-like PPIase n=1 Tax=Phenylobacterium deserti TaxID=1914756 RepID=A0A328AE86_9CAUL|nr:peptidylprolyl isomerase [Phenylobacterium deserti]RAK52959.1 rotamase [Phenylobacterium deserti]
MLAAIRAFAKSWVAAVLIGLLIVSFAIFGITDVFRAGNANTVVKAGSREVNTAEFKRAFDQMRTQLEQRAGQPITAEMAAENGFDKRLADDLALSASFAELMRKIGLHPSDKLIAGEIQKIQAFFDPVSGRFDRKQYQQRLGENGLTPEEFEREVRDQLAEQHVAAALVNGVRAPRAYSAMAAVYVLEDRDFSYFMLPQSSVPAPAAPTDAQLTAFMNENREQLTRPEFRVLTVVRFSPALNANAPVNITEDALRKRYDYRKDTFSTPERRTIVQIPARDQATAQQIVARLGRGEDPAAVARSLKVDAINYADKPQTAIADRRIGQAAFQMPAGQAAPVQGEIGLAVVKVLAVTPGRSVSFEEARPALEAELRRDAAAEHAYALSQAYDEAHQAGANLSEAAQKAGAPTVTIGPVSRDGRDPQGQPVAGLNQKLVDTAFGLPSGGESEVTDAGENEYFAVRVERVIAPSMPPLAEIRPQLAQAWTGRELAQRLETRANELAARARKGESLDALAASAGGRVVRVTNVSRQNAGQQQGTPQPVLGQALSVKPGEVFSVRAAATGFAIGKVDAVRPGGGPMLVQGVELARQQMTQTLIQEMIQSARTGGRDKIKPKVNYDLARSAIGLAPASTPEGQKGSSK